MAKYVFPFTTSPVETEDQWEEVMGGFGLQDGIVRGKYSECAVSPSTSGGLAVDVAPGVAVVGKFYYREDGVTTLNIDQAVTNDRIDLIVLRRVKSADDIYPYVLKGSESTTPVAPTPVDDGDIYDLPLAEVYVVAGATTIGTSDITDRRSFVVTSASLVSAQERTLAFLLKPGAVDSATFRLPSVNFTVDSIDIILPSATSTGVTVEYSTDFTSWTTLWSGTVSATQQSYTVNATIPPSAFVRASVTSGAPDWVSVSIIGSTSVA